MNDEFDCRRVLCRHEVVGMSTRMLQEPAREYSDFGDHEGIKVLGVIVGVCAGCWNNFREAEVSGEAGSLCADGNQLDQ